MFFLERFRILTKEARCMLLAVQLQASHQDELFVLLLFVENIAVAVPGCRHRLRAVLAEKLLQHFLPAEFTEGVLIEL